MRSQKPQERWRNRNVRYSMTVANKQTRGDLDILSYVDVQFRIGSIGIRRQNADLASLTRQTSAQRINRVRRSPIDESRVERRSDVKNFQDVGYFAGTARISLEIESAALSILFTIATITSEAAAVPKTSTSDPPTLRRHIDGTNQDMNPRQLPA